MTGFYAGSFDPFTKGHLHVVISASKMLDKLVVGIGVNSKKKRRFDVEDMKNAIIDTLKSEGVLNVQVVVYDGLTATVAKEFGADILVRGIRNERDYQEEEDLAKINQELSGLDTIFIRAGDKSIISSSMVYELLNRGQDVSKYLPNSILKIVK